MSWNESLDPQLLLAEGHINTNKQQRDYMKTAILTGANSGIGKQTAQALAGNGYQVVMICRNRDKAENARRDIIDKTGNDRIDILICDLSSMHQIKETAETIRGMYSQIDRLVNNAGILPDGDRKETDEGLELTFAVNHMAYFLLTRELMPLLESTPGSRVINVASDASRSGTFNPDNLQLQSGYSTMKAYGNSKLFNIMFTRQLAKEIDGKDITTYSLHPGVVNTNFAADSNSWFAKFFNIMFTRQLAKEIDGKDITTYSLHPGVVNTNFAADSDSWFARFFDLGRLFMRSPEKGAETSVYLCLEEGIEHLSGSYFRDKKPVKPVKAAQSDEDCKKLWERSEEIASSLLE